MKILSTILVAVILLVIGLLLPSAGVNNMDSNVDKTSVTTMQDDESNTQFKRRDYIRQRREYRSKQLNKHKVTRQVAAGSHHKDFMAYSRLDNTGMSPADFR
jgi:Flp pilus assembly protein TadB